MTTAPAAKCAGVAWGDLVRLEPRLADLLRQARFSHPCSDPDRTWYLELKPQLLRLVGWQAERDDPVLHTATAYDIAYQTCYDALPNCRVCGCV